MAWLPDGEMLCHLPPASHDDVRSRSHPYNEIAQWHDDTGREEIDPVDPIEPPNWWGDLDAGTWAKVRHDERTVKRWRVTLSCGHASEVVVTDPHWTPADGHRRVSAEEQQEMTTRLEEAWAWAIHPDIDHEHERRMLADGWPMPSTEAVCYTWPRARRIVAYERIGWLAPQPRLETKTIDLGRYEQRGDPDQPVAPTKRHQQDQANSERIRVHVRNMLEIDPPPQLSDETTRRLADLLFAPASRRRASELMRWRLRLYCGHVVERTARYTHQTVHNAFAGSISCPQCGLDPATIVAARPLGRQVDPDEPHAIKAIARDPREAAAPCRGRCCPAPRTTGRTR